MKLRSSQTMPPSESKRINRTKRADHDAYFIAIKQGDLVETRQFLAQGRTANELNEDGKNPLRYAAEFGQTEIMALLCEHGALVDYEDYDISGNRKRLPIHDAAKGGHANAITFLALRGSPLSVKDGLGLAPVHLIAGFTHHQQVQDNDDSGALRQATEQRYCQALVALCSCKEKVNLDDTDVRAESESVGRTALHRAILNKHELIALALIQLGARINTVDNNGCSPYLSAYRLGLKTVQESMLNRLACNFIIDDKSNTALHLAAEEGDVAFIEKLCASITDVNPCNQARKTPLFLAAKGGHAAAVSYLLARGGNPTITTKFSEKGPLEIARKKGHQACVVLLEEWFANPANKRMIETAELTESSEEDEGDASQVNNLNDQASDPAVLAQSKTFVDTSHISTLFSAFLGEESQIITEIKACLEPLRSEEKHELNEFLNFLDATTECPLANLATASGKNLLHIMAEFDPEATLLLALKKLTDSQIQTLLHQQAKDGKWPFHSACACRNLSLFEFCIATMNITSLLEIALSRIGENSFNAFFMLIFGVYDETSRQLYALSSSKILAEKSLARELPLDLAESDDFFLMMNRFRDIFGENIDGLLNTVDKHSNTAVMLCLYTRNAKLINYCLSIFHDRRNKLRALEQPFPCQQMQPLQFLSAYGDSFSLKCLFNASKSSAQSLCVEQELLVWSHVSTVHLHSFEHRLQFQEVIKVLIPLYGNEFIKAVLRKNKGLSILRQSLHQNGFIIEWLLELEHLPRKMDILFELMADSYAEGPLATPRSQSRTIAFPQFFPIEPPETKGTPYSQLEPAEVAQLRNKLLYRVFHRYAWPIELLEAMAVLIGCPQAQPESGAAKSINEKVLHFIKSNGGSSAKQHLLVNHVVIILALSYQWLEKKERNKSTSQLQLEQLETQYLSQFLERPEEMLRRVAELYDYIHCTDPEQAQLFLEKIAYSLSLLKKAIQESLQKPPYYEPFWRVEVPELFLETLQKILHKVTGKQYSTPTI